MLLLESVLEHGQPWVLVTALFFDGNFTSVLLKILASVCPLCCNPSNLKVTWSMVKNPHIPDCDPCTVSTPNVGSDSNQICRVAQQFCSYSTVTVYLRPWKTQRSYSRTCTDQPPPIWCPLKPAVRNQKGPMREVPSFLNRQATSLNRRYVRLNRDRPRAFQHQLQVTCVFESRRHTLGGLGCVVLTALKRPVEKFVIKLFCSTFFNLRQNVAWYSILLFNMVILYHQSLDILLDYH